MSEKRSIFRSSFFFTKLITFLLSITTQLSKLASLANLFESTTPSCNAKSLPRTANHASCLQVTGFEPVNCRVGRHSRQSVLPLRPEEAPNGNGSAPPSANDHILVQTTTDLALATVRLTSRYFVENKLQLALLIFTKQDAEPWEVAPRSTVPLPLGTTRAARLVVKTEGCVPRDFFHQTADP